MISLHTADSSIPRHTVITAHAEVAGQPHLAAATARGTGGGKSCGGTATPAAALASTQAGLTHVMSASPHDVAYLHKVEHCVFIRPPS